MSDPPLSAVVLSGGGTRGAYEVGVIAGIVEILDLGPEDPPPFQIFVGTSVGALNAGYLAAGAHRGDLDIERLVTLWQSLRLDEHLKIDLFGWRRPRSKLRSLLGRQPQGRGYALLDAAPLEGLIRDALPWERLHANLASGAARAMIAAALEVGSGRTHIFAELAPGVDFAPSRDPRRQGVITRLTPDHLMASAAIPGLFPPRRVGDRYYYDGGVRFNTPIAPAIRVGAERLAVITPIRAQRGATDVQLAQPGLGFLVGKLLNALLLDPVAYDLQVLQRFNRVVETLEAVLDDDEMARVQQTLVQTRGAPYRRLDVLDFSPEADLGRIAADYLRSELGRLPLDWRSRWLLRRALRGSEEADWASYVIFEGGLAKRLIAIGREDAWAQADAVRATLGP